MNNSNLIVWYESGSCDEFHMPDPPYDTGVALQREYVDVANPDEGIFLERSYMSFSDDDPAKEVLDKPQMSLYSRTMIVSPDELEAALSVDLHGIEVLRRDPMSRNKCGLSVTTAATLGFMPEAVLKSPRWRGEALTDLLTKMHEMGGGDEEIRRRLDAFFAAIGNDESAASSRSEANPFAVRCTAS